MVSQLDSRHVNEVLESSLQSGEGQNYIFSTVQPLRFLSSWLQSSHYLVDLSWSIAYPHLRKGSPCGPPGPFVGTASIFLMPQYNVTLFYILNCITLSKIHVEALTPNVTVFGTRPIRRQLRLNEVIRVGPWSARISVLVRRDIRGTSLALSVPMHQRREKKNGCLQARKRAFAWYQIG